MIRTYAVGSFNTANRLDDHTGPWIPLTTLGDTDSQWRDVMSDPTDPDKVIIVGSAQIAGGFNGSIQVSSDAGVTWTIPGGDWTDSADFFHELWYVNTNVIWAVNSSGIVVRSTDGGLNFNLAEPFGVLLPQDTLWTSAIHALDENVAVVLGSPTGGQSEPLCYVWITTDAGLNWGLLNGGATLSTNLINPVTGNPWTTVGAANGIWMSSDQQKIITGTGYLQHRSIDGGATFLDAGTDIHRSGNHLTWFPSYDADPQYYRHTGGAPLSVTESNDAGASYILTRAYEPGSAGIIPSYNLPIQILGAHFYSPQNGYYGYHNNGVAYIDRTSNGGVDGIVSHTNPTIGASYEAIWTSVEVQPFVPCFELTDCAGILAPIFTQSDLSAQDGQVITLADDTNHEIEGCWLVTATTISCPDTEEIAVYKCYDDCETCLPPVQPPEVPCPRPVDPGYNTGLCDPSIVEAVLCSFSEMIYQQMMSKRYKIEYCCLPDEENIIIRFEKIQMKLRESESLAPDPCNPECYAYQIDIDGADSAVTTYVDCFEEAQIIITDVDPDPLAIPRTIGFCALDTSVPTSVVTHPDTSIDTYILERVDECTPPWVNPRACIGYTVNMSNFTAGDQSFRYLDCDGIEVIITKPGGIKDIAQYNFCGLEGQTIVRDNPFSPFDVFNVTEGPCTGLPPCVEYTVTLLNTNLNGSFTYTDCLGNPVIENYNGADTYQIFIVCGIQGQTITCPACADFDVVESGSC